MLKSLFIVLFNAKNIEMNYSKIEKIIAGLLIPLIFFGLVLRVPVFNFFGTTSAGEKKLYNIVSILVDENLYSGIKSSVEEYSKNIQGQLKNTRVVIIPTPQNASPFKIASLNENLFYEGYKGLKNSANFESKLIGTVLIGDINIPLVFRGKKSLKTILPYTDFIDKEYIYNHKTNRYEKNTNNLNGAKAEIWHGVINPNTGNKGLDILAINNYFKKNNDFYKGTGNFQINKGIVNGKKSDKDIKNYKPYVFYFDEFREQAGVSYSKYKGYEAYLDNKEDIVYQRYSKDLANRVKNAVLGADKEQMKDLIEGLDSNINFDEISKGPDVSVTTDISTRFITNNATKKFLEVVNSSLLGEFRKNVNNAGRYSGTGSKVNVDLIPYLISSLDVIGDEVIKAVNNELEVNIDNLVKNGLSRDIAISTVIKYKNSSGNLCTTEYENILFGKQAKDIKNANECSIYRGNNSYSGTLVEANRGLNIKKIKGDLESCRYGNTQGFWGGNSPININQSLAGKGKLELNSNRNLKGAIRPLFDIIGANFEKDNLKVASPLNCLENNFFVSFDSNNWIGSCSPSYQLPINGKKSIGWNCATLNKKYKFKDSFTDLYKKYENPICVNYDSKLFLDGKKVSELEKVGNATINDRYQCENFLNFYESKLSNFSNNFCNNFSVPKSCKGLINDYKNFLESDNNAKNEISAQSIILQDGNEFCKKGVTLIHLSAYNQNINTCNQASLSKKDFYYKKIPSYIEHKSPTLEEYGIEVKNTITPNLPVDRNRYIDFIGASGKYQKIFYPYLFRINQDLSNIDNLDNKLKKVSEVVDKYLDDKSSEINLIIRKNNPSSLSGVDLEIYKLLKNGNYPSPNFDLKNILKSKAIKTLKENNDTKQISVYDMLIFSVFWNSLDSVPQKYKFIFENYLVDQFSNDKQYNLAKNKKIYEIAYLGAPGDAQNMFVKLDPEEKGKNPYARINAANANLNTQLFSHRVNYERENSYEGDDKCAPPEGVVLWEWIPAVMCRLDSLLPAKQWLRKSRCSSKTLFMDDENNNEPSEGEDENISCGVDSDKNGISDCIEEDFKKSKLTLESNSIKTFYNKTVDLKTKLVNNKGLIFSSINGLKVKYVLTKVEVKKDTKKELNSTNRKIIYNLAKIEELSGNNKEKYELLKKKGLKRVSKYLSFKELEVPINKGKSSYYFSVKNHDANLYFRAIVEIKDKDNKKVDFRKSNILEVKVRGELFSSTMLNITTGGKKEDIDKGIKASDQLNVFIFDTSNKDSNVLKKISIASSSKNKVVFGLSNTSKNSKNIALNYPLKISIEKDGKIIEGEKEKLITKSDLSGFMGLYSLKDAGEYKLIIKDSVGASVKKSFTILADVLNNVEIKLGSNIVESTGVITSNLILLKDRFGNIVNGQNFDIELNLKGGGFVFLNRNNEGISNKSLKVVEGFKAFRLKTTGKVSNNIINLKVKQDNKELLSKNIGIQTVNKIDIDYHIEGNKKLIVGKNEYLVKLEVLGELGKKINSRAYFTFDSKYGKINKPYGLIKNGKADFVITTSQLAGKRIPIEIKIVGKKEIIKKYIDIFPGKPMKLDLILSKSKMQASSKSKSELKVELKDRFNNLVFNDNSTVLSVELKDKYKKIASFDRLSKKVSSGVAKFIISGTSFPGTAYFKISSNPDFKNNTFTVGKGDKQIIIRGIGENASKIQTYFFWNKDTFKGKRYNALYSVLLGAGYGDVTEKDYLAGSILFDKNNRSLAVTSMLNSPYKYNEIINIGQRGSIENVTKGSDLDQNLDLKIGVDHNNRMYLDLYNKALNTYIGKIYYKTSSNTLLKTCVSEGNNFSNCGIKNDVPTIGIKSVLSNYTVSGLGNSLKFLNSDNENLLEINKLGEIKLNSLVKLELDNSNRENYLVLNILKAGDIIGKIAFNMSTKKIFISRNIEKTNFYLNSKENTIIISMNSYLYGTKLDKYTASIYYKDPFKTKKELNEFSKSNTFGIENFERQKGIGWEGENKFLLAFAAGENVGEATKKYVSFGMINLGDPVISLKKRKKTFKDGITEKSFDATIGKRLTKDEDISEYQKFDYDKDGKDDILLIKTDGYLKLLENKNSQFLDKGNLAFIADLGDKKKVKTGDFTGDGFDDIFFINNKGNPYLLNNRTKDFVRINLSEQFKLDGKITQVESFDMDNDGKTDIVTLDDSGTINIFYGGGDSGAPYFTKKFIGSGYGLKLSSGIRNTGAAVYFDGLYQINKRDYTTGTGSQINEPLIDGLMFTSVAYGRKENITDKQKLVANLPKLNSSELSGSTQATREALLNLYSTNSGSISIQGEGNSTDIKTFIKSEYSNVAGIEIEKKYIDVNGGNLQSGDIVDVEVNIKNISTSRKSNIVYIDKVPEPFKPIRNSLRINRDYGHEGKAPAGYDFMFHQISIDSGKSFKLKYKLKTQSFRVGYIKVGLFEKGETGDDDFGDIIIKPNKQNCSETVEMFRSVTARTYVKGKQEPVCDESKLKLPDILERNKLDINPKNGIPDYIDKIKNDPEEQKKYAQEQLNKLSEDTDGDGIPDTDDISVNFNNNSLQNGFLDNLNRINQDAEKITEQIDNIIEGYACGFGGGGCIATPLNWAPLLPGQDPTLMGRHIGDGNKVSEGLPVFSAMTNCLPIPHGGCIPFVWPPISGGAGGRLGTSYAGNFVRLNVSPTLTGAMGVTACFGQPQVSGNLPPSGVNPVAIGGNCIVAAMPLLKCSNDGENGDPESLGGAEMVGDSFGVLNGNCADIPKKEAIILNQEFLENYYKYKKRKKKIPSIKPSKSLVDKYIEVAKYIVKNPNQDGKYGDPGENVHETEIRDRHGKSGPLFSFNEGGVGEGSLDISLDFSAIGESSFKDIIKISQKRISAFPSFLMDWATRQIEEFVTKLTDLPTLYVILPDFSGITNVGAWLNYSGKDGIKKHYTDKVAEEKNNRRKIELEIKALEKQYSDLKCDEHKFSSDCSALFLKIKNKKLELVAAPAKEAMSGIREVYNFLGNVPLVAVKPQQINVEIPWVTNRTIDKTLNDWKMAVKQYEEEYNDWKNNPIVTKVKINENFGEFIGNINRNIEILEEYKKFPDKLLKLINQKNIRLEQILCNIEGISKITGDWITFNGKRFKAWVETYILIKAILKSWQAVIDVFYDYEAECHECKNERSDLLDEEFHLISMILPKFPIIKFPKLPDIILDIHNIRAGLTIMIPDLNIKMRPIILPSLPTLTLPRVNLSANLDIKFPDVPPIPELEDLPDFPDIPTLPSVELPNLPPPFKLPKLFPSLEGVVKILKLITKAMCILKTSPFVPEWRAGDQVAFLTERNGYLPMDFIHLSTPEFSFPWVDVIKVKTFVNLEFETEYLTEMVRAYVDNFNSKTSNFLNSFSNANLDFLDFSNYGIDANVNSSIDSSGVFNGENVDTHTNANIDVNLPGNELDVNSNIQIDTDGDSTEVENNNLLNFNKNIIKNVIGGYLNIYQNKNETVDSTEFLSLVNKSLSKIIANGDPRTEKITKIWDSVNKYDYEKENKLIADLQKNNKEKFEAVKSILNNEIRKTNKLKKDLKKSLNNKPKLFRKVSITGNNNKDFVNYNKTLDKYNDKFLESAKNLIVGSNENSDDKYIKSEGKKLLARVNNGMKNFKDSLSTDGFSHLNRYKLLANNGNNPTTTRTQNACQKANNSDYKYKYEGLYIVEKNRSYRLFNYLDELNGDEVVTPIDFDKDGDEDLLYFTDGNLYLKENLSKKPEITHVANLPLIMEKADNKFFRQGNHFIEAINGFKEINTDVGSINVSFDAPTDKNIKHFKLEYYTIVDKFLNKGNASYIPKNVSKNVVDAIVDIDNNELDNNGQSVIHPAYISYVGVIPGVKLITTKMENIKNKKNIVLTSGTRIYTARQGAKIKYSIGENKNKKFEKEINAYSSIGFDESINIENINGDIYIKTEDKITLVGTEKIGTYIGLPLFSDTKIKIDENFRDKFTEQSHIEITYGSGTKYGLNFKDISSYQIYDLGNQSSDYLIKTDRNNDFYYAKIYALYNGLKGTYSRQVVLSPQKEADDSAPDLNIFGTIKIPVYQKKTIDLTNNIYENSGIGGIDKVKIDFDLNVDSDGDGNPKNDNDTVGIKIKKTNVKLEVEFGKFDKLIKKKIGVTLTDKNGNISFKELDFEVYAPIPQVKKVENGLVYGKINEDLSSEPVNLYRLRGGVISKIDDKNVGEKVNTIDAGAFNFNVEKNLNGLVIKKGNRVIANINEYTGKISLQGGLGYYLAVENDNTYYPKIVIYNSAGKKIYYEYIKLLDNREISIVNNMSNLEKKGIYLKLLDSTNFNYYKVPTGVSYNPGATVIYRQGDNKKRPIFIIFPDGRVKIVNHKYNIIYKNYNKNIGLTLISRSGNKKIANVLYNIEGGYLMK